MGKMLRSDRAKVVVTIALAQAACGAGSADVMQFTDKQEWIEAAGPFATVDFTGFPNLTVITDQYADLGIYFTGGDDRIFLSQTSFPNDGAGLDGNDAITAVFDEPRAWFGVDHPGFVTMEIFSGEKSIYVGEFGAGGAGNFGGIISSLLFDKIVLTDPIGDVEIDDLHFGVPAPGAIWLLGLTALCHVRRRRS
jgi:MYXO-CTERM domain-containing protein